MATVLSVIPHVLSRPHHSSIKMWKLIPLGRHWRNFAITLMKRKWHSKCWCKFMRGDTVPSWPPIGCFPVGSSHFPMRKPKLAYIESIMERNLGSQLTVNIDFHKSVWAIFLSPKTSPSIFKPQTTTLSKLPTWRIHGAWKMIVVGYSVLETFYIWP